MKNTVKKAGFIFLAGLLAMVFLVGCGNSPSAVRYSEYRIEGLTFSVPSDWDMQKKGIYTMFQPAGASFTLAYNDTKGASVSDPAHQKALLEGSGLTVEKQSERSLQNGQTVYQFDGKYNSESVSRDASLSVFDYQNGIFTILAVYLDSSRKEEYSNECGKLIDSIAFADADDDADDDDTADVRPNTLSVKGLTITLPDSFEVYRDGADPNFQSASDYHSKPETYVSAEFYEGLYVLTEGKQNMDFDAPPGELLSEEYPEIDGHAARRRKSLTEDGTVYAETVMDTDDGCFLVTIQGYPEEELEEIEKIEAAFVYRK